LVASPITGQAGTLVREVRNVTGATLTKGTVVYINGASGNKPTVAKAIATSDATSAQTFGLIQADIPNNSNGYLVAFGDLDGLDTSAFAEGVQLYLSATTAGAYTSTKQYAPSHLVYIGVVTRQHVNQGRIEVRIQNGYEMDELHDVAAQTPSNNDGLFYNSTNSLWENKSIATALGYTPANAATTLTINGVTYDLSANRTFTVGSVTGSGASGQVAYWNGTTSQAGSNNLFWDNANGRLGIGTNAPTRAFDINRDANDALYININNINTGNACVSGLLATATTGQFTLQAFGSGFTPQPSNNIINSSVRLRSSLGMVNGMYIITAGEAPMIFGTNDTQRLRIFGASGNVLIQNGGTFTDGGQRLQVQGTTLLNGNVTFSSSTGMFWDATNSRLGIGTNAPTNRLTLGSAVAAALQSSAATLFSSMQDTSNIFALTVSSDTGVEHRGVFAATRSRGTLLAPTAVLAGDSIFTLIGSAYDGSATQATALITFAAESNASAGNAPQTINFITGSSGASRTTKAQLRSNGNLLLQNGGTFTDSGERLQVTGTMKVTGASSFGGNMALTLNQNAATVFTITNTNSNANAYVALELSTTSYASLFKHPTGRTYKFVLGNDLGFYNGASGDICILNDNTSGNIKLGSGGSSTAHMTIKSNGRINMSSLPTSSTGLATGDLWNDAGTIKIV
jgi:hypothetical protein